MGKVRYWKRFALAIKIIFGRYEILESKYIYHPKYSPSRVTLRHKAFDWDKGTKRLTDNG